MLTMLLASQGACLGPLVSLKLKDGSLSWLCTAGVHSGSKAVWSRPCWMFKDVRGLG